MRLNADRQPSPTEPIPAHHSSPHLAPEPELVDDDDETRHCLNNTELPSHHHKHHGNPNLRGAILDEIELFLTGTVKSKNTGRIFLEGEQCNKVTRMPNCLHSQLPTM
jgi:hypothetical protein